jgi:hypothetical protein
LFVLAAESLVDGVERNKEENANGREDVWMAENDSCEEAASGNAVDDGQEILDGLGRSDPPRRTLWSDHGLLANSATESENETAA